MLRYKTLPGVGVARRRHRLILIIAASTPNPSVSVGVASGREAYLPYTLRGFCYV
ncbi:MAG: hypothetical protein V7K40_23940 [Nostoc sp.]